MKTLMMLLLAVSMVGCATARTKYTDPVMRVMIDPDSIDQMNYVRVQKALVESGKWRVVDRGAAYSAIKKEQERQYQDESERFANREKWAHWGKMYGVGGVIAAQTQCEIKKGFWNDPILSCFQYLAVVDATTGEVITAVDGIAEDGKHFYGETKVAPSWDETVEKLNKSFPTHFKTQSQHKNLVKHSDEAEQIQRNLANQQGE